jgi:hypothetical protein
MALKVIGSGLGRTGTMSLKLALEQLGFARCYHMIEVFMNPQNVPLWIGAAEGKPEWDKLFEGYAATVDYPAAHFWRELAAYYPHAKVLHSVRDPDKWFESTQATIFSAQNKARVEGMPEMRRFFDLTVNSEFGDKITDRDFMVAYFRRHTEEVKAAIPKERLLVYEAGQGWEPLCKLLDVPVPATPFPRENTRDEFVGRMKRTPDLDSLREEVKKIDPDGHGG